MKKKIVVDIDFLLSSLLEYMHLQSVRYENDFRQLLNNVTLRKADPVDYLELIMAQTRIGTSDKIFEDIQKIIAMSLNR